MAFPRVAQPVDAVILQELARRHKDSYNLFLWTLIGGALCFWPALIVAYLEYNKMRDIKIQVAAYGIDPCWWETAYGAR